MEIKLPTIRKELTNLSFFIDEYEDINSEIYGALLNKVDYWQDSKSNNYYNHLEKEKFEIKSICSELADIRNVYSLILKRYSELGDTIFLDMDKVSDMFEYFTEYLLFLESILRKYYNLDSNLSNMSFIQSEISTLKNVIETLKKVKSKLKSTINKISDIETDIHNKISKIDIEVIKESDINEYI